jgi:hypothetical protein
LAKFVALLASILSLATVFRDAFFTPAMSWSDRLQTSVSGLALAAAICIASGYIFAWADRKVDSRFDAWLEAQLKDVPLAQTNRPAHLEPSPQPARLPSRPLHAWSTLPVKLLLWGSILFGLALALAWYMETQVIPLSNPAR